MAKNVSPVIIYKNGLYTLEQSAECAVPGYLILRLKGPETSLAGLATEQAKALGEALSRAVRAIEQAAGADRVYILSFCEVERRLHFHLFPRTAWLLREYRKANGGESEAINGPLLFEWARKTFVPGHPLPAGMPGRGTVSGTLREKLQ